MGKLGFGISGAQKSRQSMVKKMQSILVLAKVHSAISEREDTGLPSVRLSLPKVNILIFT